MSHDADDWAMWRSAKNLNLEFNQLQQQNKQSKQLGEKLGMVSKCTKNCGNDL